MNVGKKNISMKSWGKLALVLGVYLLITVLLKGNFLSNKYSSILVMMAVNIILAVSLNLTTGFLGELTLGHAGFMSIGAYTGSLITMNLNLPWLVEILVAIIAGGCMAAIFGLIVGFPVLRLRGDYLAIMTLAFGEIVKSIFMYLPITQGAKGLSGIENHTGNEHYTLVYILVIVSVVLIANLIKTRHGRAICAIRDNYIAAEASGINVSKYKVMTFVIAAFFAGVAGVIYAHDLTIIKPNQFDYNKSIEILVIVVLGGMGSIRGSIIAAIILTILPQALRAFSDYRMLIYSIVLIAIMIFNNSQLKTRILESEKLPKFLKKKED